VVCSGEWSQLKGKQKAKGKAKAGNSGEGGGPSNKAAAAGSSSGEASTSRGEGSRSSTLPSASAGHRSVVEDAVQPALPSAEVASDTQQTQPQPAGGGKKEKERLRKERQRQRKMDEAKEALQAAIEAMLDARCVSPLWFRCIGRDPPFPGEVVVSSCSWQGALTCGGVCGCSGESSLLGAVEAATAEAEKHGDRSSELLTALVAEAKGMIEKAKTEQAERARAAAEEAKAAAAVKAVAAAERARVAAEAEAVEAVKRQQLEERLAALALETQQVQAELGSGSGTPQPGAEETMCVVCFDAPKDHIIVPCYHLCVCEACANLLTQMDKPTCPICRTAIQQTNRVFQS
jgi:hypothetical protein